MFTVISYVSVDLRFSTHIIKNIPVTLPKVLGILSVQLVSESRFTSSQVVHLLLLGAPNFILNKPTLKAMRALGL